MARDEDDTGDTGDLTSLVLTLIGSRHSVAPKRLAWASAASTRSSKKARL